VGVGGVAQGRRRRSGDVVDFFEVQAGGLERAPGGEGAALGASGGTAKKPGPLLSGLHSLQENVSGEEGPLDHSSF
jgi:hypothetical protein